MANAEARAGTKESLVYRVPAFFDRETRGIAVPPVFTINHLLTAGALLPTATVVAVGAMSATAPPVMRDGATLGLSLDLEFADGNKALFRTEDGVSLVTVGSNLPSAGRVLSIAQRDGHWTVTTNRNLVFTQDRSRLGQD